MIRIDTRTPPMVKVIDGKVFVVVVYSDGDETREIWAKADGDYFASQVWEKVVVPRLRG